MASRRKSAKPTNKAHHQVEIDDDDDDETESMKEARMSLEIISYIQHLKQRKACCTEPAVEKSTHSPDHLIQLQDTEPHIALPSDIYQDFEALKSATKLDTTELMRKLLNGYQLTSATGQPSRDRKLDDAIDDLFQARSASVLDLSRRNGSSPMSYSLQQEGKSSPLQGYSFTDDQLAMGILDSMQEGDDSSNDLKPLDLTLHRKDSPSSLDSATMRGIHVNTNLGVAAFSPVLNCPAISNKEPHCSQTFKHAGSYVINLEPRNSSPLLANSSLAQVLQMDIPLHGFSKIQKQSAVSPESVHGKDGSYTASQKTSSDPCVSNAVHFRSKLFHGGKPFSPMAKTFGEGMGQSSSGFSSPPSYAEAVTSVLNSQQNKRVSSISESLSFVRNLDTNEQDIKSRSLSCIQINAEDPVGKFIPFTISPKLTSSQENQRQQNLLQQLLQNQIKAENKPPAHLFQQSQQQQQHLQNTSKTSETEQSSSANNYSNSPVSHVPMLQFPELLKDFNDMKHSSKMLGNNESPYPNFLLESNSVGIPSISNALATSSSLPNTSVPLSTFFMTTSANGGVGHMVAIPLIHAVSDGVTGFQPFAFAPHQIPAPNTSSTPTTQSSADVSIASIPVGASKTAKLSNEMVNQEPTSSILFTSELHPSPLSEVSKPKPGRPRGRGGRGSSQKSQNKDMKLLTENTLFPGVYTSILKLPWSRRSRNKTKVKAISELKKQAQIIVHGKITEHDDCVTGDKLKKEEEIEDKDINRLAMSKNILSQKIMENSRESEEQLQNDLEDSQRRQMQQQKLKDLEQQQRLHLQYHLRLQEEQRKLTKQIEQSYINTSAEPALALPFAATNQQILQGKILDSTQKEFSKLPVSMGSSVLSDSIGFSQPVFSKDALTVVYSYADTNTLRKTPRKRGRPPKIPNLPSKACESQLPLITESIAGSADQYDESVNFLQTNTVNSGCAISTKGNLSIFPNSVSAPVTFEDVSPTVLQSEDTGNDRDNEMTLEKKITFLTNQIGLELSKNGVSESSNANAMNKSQTTKCAEDTTSQLEDMMYQEMKIAVNKSLIDIKPRRKKVSRLLKSDENFMYATFKIKPKGLTPRKSRRRRKDVLANTAAVAETIANLRKKSLHEGSTPSSTSDSSKPLSMVAWKFHEQYAFIPEEGEEEEDANKDKTVTCLKCGSYFLNEHNDLRPHLCKSCLLESSDVGDYKDGTLSNIGQMRVGGADVKAEVCVSCGCILQKHFSDTSVTCGLCRNNTPGSIKTSKLFSFQDSPEDTPPAGRLLGNKTPPSGTFVVSPAESQNNDKGADRCLAKMNNNHLYCSQCRMVFTKICDYLAHSRDTHETKHSEKRGSISGDSPTPNDSNRKPRVSKTKKSLAHKTLTCPVEECPHFFREQKDLDLHFMKKHSNLNSFPKGECGFPYQTAEDLDNNQQLPQNSSTTAITTTTSTSAQLGRGNTKGNDGLNNEDKAAASAISCEKPLQCEFCDYRCRQKNALTWHMRKHPEAASQYRRYNNLNAD
ncbi:unnamed protein product [Candidula unifasciata]|uniref:C2H2-type domain-containing protein n=1 Tax=Candidula unifasciata TaxID=100452 RepID=A0A8S3ZFF3_9EUPU|nr:unnamed protein product [Candidula unifasciata]